MRKRRILPATWPSTMWSLSSFTRNIAFGRASITSPSNSILSSFGTRPAYYGRWARNIYVAPVGAGVAPGVVVAGGVVAGGVVAGGVVVGVVVAGGVTVPPPPFDAAWWCFFFGAL